MSEGITAREAKAMIRRTLEESEVEGAHMAARIDRLKAAFPSAFPEWTEDEKAGLRRRINAAIDDLQQTTEWLESLHDQPKGEGR